MSDGLKKIVTNHRRAVRNNAVASETIEVQSEKETLLEEIVLIIEEVNERHRTEQDERTELYERLLAAGEERRDKATSQNSSKESTESRKPRKKQAVMVDSYKVEKDLIEEHMVARREVVAKRVRLVEERFAFDQRVEERNDARALRQQEHDAKRLPLDQRRIEVGVERACMDMGERFREMEERKRMIAVLDAVVKKLQ
ncbi:hypothetical protein BWQ96_05648 [Gracilariopsis chorda]|uniref:Uncharacterized protein n=1 Tax=Gracilariopsis chorda TaxID=448386 RepID=A0A2V3IR17_9FLOR|nr:hypothetical protein BWQ96_05648 [Gracilariopsis chorda]|eukprot:PXF44571.1 hypothetical protein BWQ96_05648 [Gracilariopsis chorda]